MGFPWRAIMAFTFFHTNSLHCHFNPMGGGVKKAAEAQSAEVPRGEIWESAPSPVWGSWAMLRNNFWNFTCKFVHFGVFGVVFGGVKRYSRPSIFNRGGNCLLAPAIETVTRNIHFFLPKSDVKSLDFVVTCFLMKLFRSVNYDVILDCCKFFEFTLPSEYLVKKSEKIFLPYIRTSVVCIGTLPLLWTDWWFFFIFVNLCY